MAGLVSVLAGSALGGIARYWISGLIGRWLGEAFPWGTLAVNGSGAFLIGLCAVGVTPGQAGWQFIVIGFLGSYTTVSSFSLQTLTLLQQGAAARALGNIVLSVALCLGFAALGYAIGVGAAGQW